MVCLEKMFVDVTICSFCISPYISSWRYTIYTAVLRDTLCKCRNDSPTYVALQCEHEYLYATLVAPNTLSYFIYEIEKKTAN